MLRSTERIRTIFFYCHASEGDPRGRNVQGHTANAIASVVSVTMVGLLFQSQIYFTPVGLLPISLSWLQAT
jgi:hypothetical protein